jgi:hypothetical protein
MPHVGQFGKASRPQSEKSNRKLEQFPVETFPTGSKPQSNQELEPMGQFGRPNGANH